MGKWRVEMKINQTIYNCKTQKIKVEEVQIEEIREEHLVVTQEPTLEERVAELEQINERQDVEIALNQDAINFMLFQTIGMNLNENTKGVNMMAAYFANQILKGKLDYTLVVSRYPEYKEGIDTILIGERKQDLIK